jgi:1-acyl-sn-glycerol-3-phosphate acyltransferase
MVGLRDVLRTIRVAITDVVPVSWYLATTRESSNSSVGLARARITYANILRHLAIRLEVLHTERVPTAGGVIFMWNQESHLDHLVLALAIPRPFLSLYNNAVARVPLYGKHMRQAGHIHVDRTDEAQWRAAIARAAELAGGGECILVSPEGTRSWDGELLPMKRGALMLALAAAVPIVCVTVIGGHRCMPRGSPWVRSGTIRIVFSEPIDAAESTPEALAETLVATFRAHKQLHRLSAQPPAAGARSTAKLSSRVKGLS